MNVWIQNPFDNLPGEGYRKQRFGLMAEAFARAGHRTVLWTGDFNHMTKAKRRLEGSGGLEGVEVRLIPTLPYRKNVGLERVRSHRAYAREWERLAAACPPAERPDLIVASAPTIGGAEAAIRLGRRFGARVVVDVMDAWPETFERLAPGGLRWLAKLALAGLRRRIRRVYREADRVTGVCERYRALTGRADYRLAYHGIELAPRLPSHAANPPASAARLRLVYAGNLGLTYDLGTVLRGLAGLDGVTLDVAGRGRGEETWKRLARELGLADRVTFRGYLSDGALRDLLDGCDVGLVPMPADSFVGVPYKFADYSSAGLAIVSSLGGESAALLDRYGCGAAYATGDAAGFAKAVEGLRERLDEARAGSRRMAEREFDAVRIYDAYVSAVTASA